MSIQEVFQALLGQGGSLLLLLIAVVAFAKEWVVPGHVHRRVLRERDRALEIGSRGVGVAERMVRHREAHESGEEDR